MYITQARGRQPQGTKFWCQQKPLVTSIICYKFQKNLFEVCYTIFSWFYTYIYSPGPGADNPLGTKLCCQQEHLVTSVICCKFQKNLFQVWFYTIFFMIKYMYIAPRAGADSPQGTKFLYQQKRLITLPICCKFQRNLFEVWFYTIFFMI